VSVTFVDCVKRNKDIFEIFSPSGSHTILVCPYQTGWQYSDANALNGECRWGGQKSWFWTYNFVWARMSLVRLVQYSLVLFNCMFPFCWTNKWWWWWWYACCWQSNNWGVVNMVAGGSRPPSCKLWQLYRWSYTAGIRPPSATRDKVTVSVVLQRESDLARSCTIHNHDRSYVYNSKAWRYAEDNRTESNCMH